MKGYKALSSRSIAVLASLVSSALISYPHSGNFDLETLPGRLLRSLAYTLASALVIAFYCWRVDRQASFRFAMLLAAVMMVAASLVYSVGRQYVVVLALPSLFCLTGAAVGHTAATHFSTMGKGIIDRWRK